MEPDSGLPDSVAELLPLLGRPEAAVRARAAEALAGRLGSTAAAREALLSAVGAGASEPVVPYGLAGPPQVLDPTFRIEAAHGDSDVDMGDAASHRLPPSLVPTEHAERVLRQLSLALCLPRPVLLSGPPGAGKTTLLSALAGSVPQGGGGGGAASSSQLDRLVTVHLDEQVDSRALLGAYVCGAEPGEFVWQPGVVTQAVAQGRWLLLEDVDRAPLEVMSALAPLLEHNVLFVPGRAASMSAAPGFRLWGTVTTHGRAEVAAVERNVFKAALWQHVAVAAPSAADLEAIVRARFPRLEAAAGALVTAFLQLQHASGGVPVASASAGLHSSGGDAASASAGAAEEVAPSLAVAAEKALASARLALSGGRVFSSRELFRWCKRLSLALTPADAYLPPPDQPGRFSSFFRELLVAEALDTFVAPVRRAAPRAELASLIAAQWQLPAERLRHMVDLRRPELEADASQVSIGRVSLPLERATAAGAAAARGEGRFARTRHALVTLERVAACVQLGEPMLLVGETGTGKTTAVQQLAALLGKTLLVHNLNQQSDSSELVGGFRPVQPRHVFAPLAARFEALFCRSFSRSKNGPFLAKLAQRLAKGEWAKMLALLSGASASYARLRSAASTGDGAEAPSAALDAEWESLGNEAARLAQQLKRRGSAAADGLAFAFVEGSLVQALREGHWLLLDEVNLASPETLERVAGLLEEGGSLALTEKGEADLLPRHPGFRLFAAMNPPTDFGKKELPAGIRTRLTELYVPAITSPEDLSLVVLQYLSPVLPAPPVGAIVALYLAALSAASTRLLDGADQRPEYSLRTLCRALSYVAHALPLGYGLHRALYDAFHMTFVAQLQARFQPEVEAMLLKHLAPPARPGKAPKPPPAVAPARPAGEHWVEVGGFWLATDPRNEPVADDPKYIVTPSVEARLTQLARMCAARRHPILLQGPTSAGKTSMVERLARRTGHRLVRINNHEHTDVQEYIGSFQPDAHGRLIFCDGALAQAVRHGYWIVLDELNLAQSEVLEALNRLLDDNRELYIPETSETLSPHPNFMLFATQNPPGAYGGRKVLSRAFRNRFLEMQMDEIPEPELVTILEKRSALPASFCKAMVAVMQELQRRRSSSRVFAGRAGFITPRDLFRWADRVPATYQELAEIGYALLAERLRAPAEKDTVAAVLGSLLPRVAIEPEVLYSRLLSTAPGGAPRLGSMSVQGTVWLPSTRRLYALVAACMHSNEPILLVGETGTGKTTVCQLYAQAVGQHLHIINCHQHTETADFVGGLRPTRGRSLAIGELARRVAEVEADAAKAVRALPTHVDAPMLLGGAEAVAGADEATVASLLCARAERVVTSLAVALEALGLAPKTKGGAAPAAVAAGLQAASAAASAVAEELRASAALFVWVDGPLLTAMRKGEMLLIDEISLAEDSVLERLNSVLDPCRLLTLPEKGSELEVVQAAPSFRLLATMNPGGDFGKKELSPALRNRFTEVWVPTVTAHEELKTLIAQTLGELGGGGGAVPMETEEEEEWEMAEAMLAFVEWLAQPRAGAGGGGGLGSTSPSLRDLLAWAGFVKATQPDLGRAAAFVHGACLTFVDSMGLQVSSARADRESLRAQSVAKLVSLLPTDSRDTAALHVGRDTFPLFALGSVPAPTDAADGVRHFGLHPFFVPMGSAEVKPAEISLSAPTPRANAFRVLRAMQLRKPVLLEGSPGVGKTSLVTALGAACGVTVVRINLSEQTDLMDLLGSDLPVEGAPAGTYAWQDGAFLAALRAGHWVILDELNLAPQAVLEGLNACLDHRATVFIPELGASFECPPSFRVFGCQNPLQQGGGRKGLPKSFLNRFTQVWMEELDEADMVAVGLSLFGQLGEPLLRKLIGFVRTLQKALTTRRFGVAGGPWDFNLRDVFRWCELLLDQQVAPHWRPAVFFDALFLQRFRTEADRAAVLEFYTASMGADAGPPPLQPHYAVGSQAVQIGHAWLPRAKAQLPPAPPLQLLPAQLRPIQAMALGVRMGWMIAVGGETGAGKSSAVRLLARLAGRRMDEVVLSTATDTTELLGCFEQSEASRLHLAVLKEADELVAMLTAKLALAGARAARDDTGGGALLLAAALQQAHGALADGGAERRAIAGPTPSPEWADAFESRAADLLALLDRAAAEPAEPAAAQDVLRRVGVVRAHVASLAQLRESGSKGRFVWVDGPLVHAMENGHWLLLDNANLCNPSVLDRLNPLFERGGVLQLPEAGLQAGGLLREILPHADFRLFLAVDPAAGELSRAMRNRGIEVAMLPPKHDSRDVLATLRCGGAAAAALGAVSGHGGSEDVSRDEGGVPGAELSLAMVAAHGRLAGLVPRALGQRALLHCGELLVQRLLAGRELQDAVRDATDLAYGARLLTAAADQMRDAAARACRAGAERLAPAALLLDLSQPDRPLWPVSVNTASYATDAALCGVRAQAALVVQLAAMASEASEAAAPGDDSRCAPAELLYPAALAFVLGASQRDAPLRRSLLLQLQRHAALPALALAASLLERAEAHPLVAAARAALTEACAGDASLLALCREAPCDLQTLNAPLFERVRRHAAAHLLPDASDCEAGVHPNADEDAYPGADSSETSTASAWTRYGRLLPRLRLALELEWEGLCETDLLQAALATVAPQDMGLLEQSFARASAAGWQAGALPPAPPAAVSSTRSPERAMWDNLVFPLYPALAEVGAMLAEWLVAPMAADEAALLRAFCSVRAARRALAARAMAVRVEQLQPQDTLVLWRALHKRVERASRQPAPLVPRAVRLAFVEISAAIGYEASRFASLGWKWGGHPDAPPSAGLLCAGAELHELALELLADEGEPAALVRADVALRRNLVLGVCTLQCAFSRRDESGPELERLAAIPTALRAQLEAAQAAAERPRAGPARLARLTPPLWPMLDVRSAKVEGYIYASLAELNVSLLGEEAVPAPAARALQLRAASFSGFVVDECGRNPTDACPAQTLAWQLEAPLPQGGLTVRRVPPLAGVTYQLGVVWHRHLWKGRFERAPPALASVSSLGPAYLLLSTEALSVSARLEAAYAVPMAERATAQRELKELTGHLLARPAPDARETDAARDWRLALHALCLVLEPLGKGLAPDEATQLSAMLRALRVSCEGMLGAAGSRARGPEHLSSAPATAEARRAIASLVAALCGTLRRCDERALSASVELVLAPLLRELQSAAEAMGAALDAGADVPPGHGARGRVWVLLGLLRWRLLLPTHAVDPACKHTLKAELAADALRRLRLARLAAALAQEAANGARSTPLLRRAEADEAKGKALVSAAQLKASARPAVPAAQFGQLFSELEQWGEALGGAAAVLQLSAELASGAPTALAREEAWQRGSGTFLQRLDDAYPHFEDIVAPLQLALYETKHGLRLQALCAAPTVLAAQDDARTAAAAAVRHSHAMMASLLRFPAGSVAGGRAAPDAWRAQVAPLMQALPPCVGLPVHAKAIVGVPTAMVAAAGVSSPALSALRLSAHTSMLALALRRLYVSVLLQGGAAPGHLLSLNQIVGGFVKTHVEAEAADRQRQEAEAELYARKTRDYGVAATDGLAEEAAALRELFPDFKEEFADIEALAEEGLLGGEDVEMGEEGEEADVDADKPEEGDALGAQGAAAAIKIEPSLILKVLEYHERVFRFTSGAPEPSLQPEPAKLKPTSAKRGRNKAPAAAAAPAVPFWSLAAPSRALVGASLYEEAEAETLGSARAAHSLGAKLLPSVAAAHHLPAVLDEEARGTSLVVAACCWQRLQGSDPARRLEPLPDLFSDENVGEVARLEPILDALLAAMRALLLQWPDHPALQLVSLLCERLRSFRAGSPLMKFVTGAEMLLKRCWEWEAVACKATSIKVQIDLLSALVLRWRKMEVEAWPRLLHKAAHRTHEKALLRVWAKLFHVVNSHLWSHSSGAPAASAAEPADAETRAARAAHLTEFFDTFQQLLLTAEAGAFEAYLRLMRSFATQLQTEARLGVRGEMGDEPWRVSGYAHILHNLAGYYAQFSGPLARALGAKRAPIEAKLKDFVKLAQWGDRNFDSLKQSVERSHAHLSKGVRQLQDVLAHPAATLLLGALHGTGGADDAAHADEDSGLTQKTAGVGVADVGVEAEERLVGVEAGERQAAATLLADGSVAQAPAAEWDSVLLAVGAALSATGAPLAHVPRLPALLGRMRSVCTQSVLSAGAADASSARRTLLDDLRLEIVSRCGELRGLTTKKARMLKHKALVDLLKHLAALGLSFASAAADARQGTMADLFQLRAMPLDFGSGLSAAAAPLGAAWQREWARCDELYYRAVLKLTQLRHARISAHDDLSGREVHKAAGFVEHSVALVLRQRETLVGAVEEGARLEGRLALLGTLEDEGLVPQAALAARSQLALATKQRLLQLCFESGVLFKQLGSVVAPAAAAEVHAMGATLERATRELQAHHLTPLGSGSPAQGSGPLLLTSWHAREVESLAELVATLNNDIHAASARLGSGERELAAPLLLELARAAELLQSEDHSAAAPSAASAAALDGVAAAVEEAVVHVLLAVQGMRHAPAAVEEGEEPKTLAVDHAQVQRLVGASRSAKVSLRLEAVLCALRLLAESGASSAERCAASRLVAQVRPLLALHASAARWALHQALGHHASFVRLSLVLLGTFGELFAKGFCTAQKDKEEGGGGEGSGLDDDVEGTGMGEGEGKQDVSDQLQEEGQLDGEELQPQEEEARGEQKKEDKEEERAKDEEGVEMTNDFDGEMMDMEQGDEPQSEEEAGEEPDHGMGDLDEEQQEVVDERLWDKDEDEDLAPADDDKVEKDADVAGEDSTMEAKEEEEEKPSKKQKREEDAKEEAADAKEEKGEEGEEEEEEEEGEGGVKPETEYEESHHKDLKKQEEEEEEGAEGEEMPEGAPEEVDGEMSEGGEDTDGDADEADGDPPEEAGEEEGEGEETGQAPPVEEEPEVGEDEEQGRVPEGAEAEGPEPPEEEGGEEEEAGTKKREYEEQQVFEDSEGKFAAGEPQADQEEAEDAAAETEASASAPQAQASSGEQEGGQYMQMTGKEEAQAPRAQKSRPKPNPYNALGDALQAFHQQLNLVQREPGKEDQPTATEGKEEEEFGTEADFELAGKGEASDTQVLADATQEQLEQADGAEPPREEAEGPDEAEPEPMEEEAPAEAAAAELKELAEEEQKQSKGRRGRQAAPAEVLAEAAAEADAGIATPWEVEREAAEEAEGAGRVGPVGERLAAGAEGGGEEEEGEEEVAGRSAETLEGMREDLEREIASWQLDGERVSSSEELWRKFEALTAPLSQELCEQLRLILEASVASKMQGDYRTGKRISMRKVIPYIASGYRKDKIWLRRTKPAKRQYQVMICIDDSESMASTGAGGLACEALALLCGALSRLEVGQLAVTSFAEQVQLLHPFDRPFSAEAGAHMMSRFTFAQQETDMETLLRTVVQTLRLARETQRGGAAEQMQLCIIVSDGRRSPSWGDPSLWVRRAAEEKILLCFVIIDAAANKDSILELQSVAYPDGKLTITKWIDAFPFPYYIVLRELRALPQVLSDALRQWFELMR